MTNTTDMNREMTAIGLMSGTSMDGVDAAVVVTDGRNIKEMGVFHSVAYSKDFRQKLRDMIAGRKNNEQTERELTLIHAQAVADLLDKAGLAPQDVDVIGFHGQTIDHRPDEGVTVQVGDGELLARECGIDVVCDFRSADVRAGGQGAPLVPLFHAALARDLPKSLAILNIGGVANVTYIGGRSEEDIIAFDTGPGNAMIDDWVYQHTGQNYDENGRIAASGKVNEDILQELLSNPYFDIKPPKSLDRNHFSANAVRNLSLEDGAATLTAFTAETVAYGLKYFSEVPQKWYICGGGRKNPQLMQELSSRIKTTAEPAENIGLNGDAMEAQAFAFLAVRSRYGLNLSLPSTTGVSSSSVTGGVFCPA